MSQRRSSFSRGSLRGPFPMSPHISRASYAPSHNTTTTTYNSSVLASPLRPGSSLPTAPIGTTSQSTLLTSEQSQILAEQSQISIPFQLRSDGQQPRQYIDDISSLYR